QIEALAGVGEAPVLDRLSALAERVERIAASTSSQSIGHLGGQIAALMRRLDEGGSGAGIDAARMSDLEGRLDEVLARLANAEGAQARDQNAFLDAIDQRFTALARYLESQPPVDADTLRQLSAQIGGLGEM